MPVREVDGGYRYGTSGKLYRGKDAKEKAMRQARAIRASQAMSKSGWGAASSKGSLGLTSDDEYDTATAAAIRRKNEQMNRKRNSNTAAYGVIGGVSGGWLGVAGRRKSIPRAAGGAVAGAGALAGLSRFRDNKAIGRVNAKTDEMFRSPATRRNLESEMANHATEKVWAANPKARVAIKNQKNGKYHVFENPAVGKSMSAAAWHDEPNALDARRAMNYEDLIIKDDFGQGNVDFTRRMGLREKRRNKKRGRAVASEYTPSAAPKGPSAASANAPSRASGPVTAQETSAGSRYSRFIPKSKKGRIGVVSGLAGGGLALGGGGAYYANRDRIGKSLSLAELGEIAKSELY